MNLPIFLCEKYQFLGLMNFNTQDAYQNEYGSLEYGRKYIHQMKENKTYKEKSKLTCN